MIFGYGIKAVGLLCADRLSVNQDGTQSITFLRVYGELWCSTVLHLDFTVRADRTACVACAEITKVVLALLPLLPVLPLLLLPVLVLSLPPLVVESGKVWVTVPV